MRAEFHDRDTLLDLGWLFSIFLYFYGYFLYFYIFMVIFYISIFLWLFSPAIRITLFDFFQVFSLLNLMVVGICSFA